MLEDGVSDYLELLYHGSWDIFEASDFNSKCDKNGATIAVIKSIDEFIFGRFYDWIKRIQSFRDWCVTDHLKIDVLMR